MEIKKAMMMIKPNASFDHMSATVPEIMDIPS
jgi:hypothetical protein